MSNDQGQQCSDPGDQGGRRQSRRSKNRACRLQTSISSGGMYAEFAAMEEMAKDARIVKKGDYVVMVVANTQGADYAEIDKAIDEALS